MYDVVCIGTATQDVFVSSDQAGIIRFSDAESERAYLAYEYGAKVAVDELLISTGGGAVNTAMSFARLGLKPAIICEVGRDDAGETITRSLRGQGVDTSLISHNPELKTGYSVILTGPTGDRTVLVHRGAATGLTRPEVDWEALRRAQWLYLSSLAGESASLWADVAAFACESGVRLAANPGSQQIELGLDGLAPVLAQLDVIFLNKREAYRLTGVDDRRGDADETLALQRLREAGCKLVVMTMGSEGAMAFDGETRYSVPAPEAKMVSTLGAGDAFAAGCLAALHRGLSLTDALTVGALNSGSVLGHLDASSGLLRWEEVETRLRQTV